MPAASSAMRGHLLWFTIGIGAGLLLVASQAASVGGWSGLLQVGEASLLRPAIESELGQVPLMRGGGHDGQISYGIALDLDGDEVPQLLDHGGYRYRRILYPALSSLFGMLDGRQLLVGMIALAISGMGLATMAMADIARTLGISRWSVAGVLANPGAWLGVRLLTPDALALGLAALAVALSVRRRHAAAIALLSAAVLAKDQFLLVALGLGLATWLKKEHRWSAFYLLLPAVPLSVWSTFVTLHIAEGFTPRQNLGLPFAGIMGALPHWAGRSDDLVFAAFALLLLLAGVWTVIAVGNPLVRGLALPWLLVATLSSTWVWDFGNNALRAFAFLGIPLALGLSMKAVMQPLGEAQSVAVEGGTS